MKTRQFLLTLSVVLILTSALFYGLLYLIFHNPDFIELYLLDHLAFLPIEVLIVTIVIGGVMSYRERNQRLQKLDMILGSFYSEVGRELMLNISKADLDIANKSAILKVAPNWKPADFNNAQKQLKAAETNISVNPSKLLCLKDSLLSKRAFLLNLLQNPNFLERDLLTELLQATFHLLEELEYRFGFDNLPKPDLDHLNNDVKRVYLPLLLHWLEYLQYLKVNFPYLFSLAYRTNPLNPDASVIINDK